MDLTSTLKIVDGVSLCGKRCWFSAMLAVREVDLACDQDIEWASREVDQSAQECMSSTCGLK